MIRLRYVYQRLSLLAVLILLTAIMVIFPSSIYVIPWTIVLLVLGQFFCQTAMDIIRDYLDYLKGQK